MSKTHFRVGQTVSNGEETGEIVAINLSRQGTVYEVVANDEVLYVLEKDLMGIKEGKPIKASQLNSIWNGRQTTVLLQGCPADQILSLTGQEFTDIRVTRKWFDQVKVGDILPCHTSVKPEGFEPSENTYPGKGELICEVLVTGSKLYPTFEKALEASMNNHFVLAGNSVDDLKALIESIYPNTALTRADEDEEDGYTVLTLEVVETIEEALEAEDNESTDDVPMGKKSVTENSEGT